MVFLERNPILITFWHIFVEGEATNKLSKFDDALMVEMELKRIEPKFIDFYLDVPYT